MYSETQCERDFAKDCNQVKTNRLRMTPKQRYAETKIVSDGLPVECVAKVNDPIGPFLGRVQDAYGELFGKRLLKQHTTRKDCGLPRKRRRERETVTGILKQKA